VLRITLIKEFNRKELMISTISVKTSLIVFPKTNLTYSHPNINIHWMKTMHWDQRLSMFHGVICTCTRSHIFRVVSKPKHFLNGTYVSFLFTILFFIHLYFILIFTKITGHVQSSFCICDYSFFFCFRNI
jgi:hypothetical protein